jgi:hypothetical protein
MYSSKRPGAGDVCTSALSILQFKATSSVSATDNVFKSSKSKYNI